MADDQAKWKEENAGKSPSEYAAPRLRRLKNTEGLAVTEHKLETGGHVLTMPNEPAYEIVADAPETRLAIHHSEFTVSRGPETLYKGRVETKAGRDTVFHLHGHRKGLKVQVDWDHARTLVLEAPLTTSTESSRMKLDIELGKESNNVVIKALPVDIHSKAEENEVTVRIPMKKGNVVKVYNKERLNYDLLGRPGFNYRFGEHGVEMTTSTEDDKGKLKVVFYDPADPKKEATITFKRGVPLDASGNPVVKPDELRGKPSEKAQDRVWEHIEKTLMDNGLEIEPKRYKKERTSLDKKGPFDPQVMDAIAKKDSIPLDGQRQLPDLSGRNTPGCGQGA